MESEIIKNLNELYVSDPQKYSDYLRNVKDEGYKVFRNSAGKHKVELDIYSAFGGIFGDIFGR